MTPLALTPFPSAAARARQRWPGTSGTYSNPANDFGTFVKNFDGSFTYTAYNQTKENFSASGYLTSVVDPHGLTLTYSYDGSNKLTKIQTPDTGITTFGYDGSNLLQTVQEAGGLAVLTFAHASASDLTLLTDPDGGLRSFSYDGNHKLTKEQFGPQTVTLAYNATTGMLSSIDRGQSSTTIAPVLSQGLPTAPAGTSTLTGRSGGSERGCWSGP